MQWPERIWSASKRGTKERPTPRCCCGKTGGSVKEVVSCMKRPWSAEQTREAVGKVFAKWPVVLDRLRSIRGVELGRKETFLGYKVNRPTPPATTNPRFNQSFPSTPSSPFSQNVSSSFCFSLSLSRCFLRFERGKVRSTLSELCQVTQHVGGELQRGDEI